MSFTGRVDQILVETTSWFPSKTAHALAYNIHYHAWTVYLICSGDILHIIGGGLLFAALNSSIAPGFCMGPALSLSELLAKTPSILLWSASNFFLFCLHNQMQAATIAEDMLNKPWRPIASGRLTPRQAKIILYYLHPSCLIIALCAGGLLPYAILTPLHIWYNEFGGASNGVLKNILNGVGIACFFAGPLEVATNHSILAGKGDAASWFLILIAAFSTTSHTQDFRDTEGDKLAGRRTIPMVIGDVPARIIIVLGILGWTEAACLFWSTKWLEQLMVFSTGGILITNLLLCRHRQGDTRAWKLWFVWVLTLVMLPVVKGKA